VHLRPLKEGYRGWGGGIGLSKNLEGMQLDAAYEYINWMLDGWVGAFLGRQGYYSAAPETARKLCLRRSGTTGTKAKKPLKTC
jgi:putative spermidine/putrescine transport system substrate-binding protein